MRPAPAVSATWFLLSILALGGVAKGGEPAPVAVSPGKEDRLATTTLCPTFSWISPPTDQPLHLVVFDLGGRLEDLDVGEAPLAAPAVLEESLHGGATSWTPPARLCLQPGGLYAWSLGRQTEGESWQWAKPQFFKTVSDPQGPDRIGSRLTDSRSASLPARTDLGSAREARAIGAPATSSDPSGLSAAASTPAADYGLVGITNSTSGAGVAAENTSGGADLILFGTDWNLRLTEAGMGVETPDAVTFEILNSDDAGTLTLMIDGVPALTTATGALLLHDHEAAAAEDLKPDEEPDDE